MEGQCHSGQHHDCHGSANLVTCCQGHYQGRAVGPTDQCTWEYFDHGQQMECGRSDEIIVGRCGSGMNKGELTHRATDWELINGLSITRHRNHLKVIIFPCGIVH